MNTRLMVIAPVVSLLMGSASFADAIRLTNGDMLNGTVVSLNDKSLVLNSANFGELTISREKVALIALGEQALPNSQLVETGTPQASPSIESMVPSLQSPQLQGQLDQLFGEALGGKSVRDMQGDLKTARDRLKNLQDDLGDGPEGDAVGAYLRIFEQFLPPQKSQPPGNGSSSSPKEPMN